MLHPSYTDLLEVVNQDVEEGNTKIVNSRYSIILATSKRARQIIAGQKPLVDTKVGQKPLSVAIDELNNSKIKIVAILNDYLEILNFNDKPKMREIISCAKEKFAMGITANESMQMTLHSILGNFFLVLNFKYIRE